MKTATCTRDWQCREPGTPLLGIGTDVAVPCALPVPGSHSAAALHPGCARPRVAATNVELLGLCVVLSRGV